MYSFGKDHFKEEKEALPLFQATQPAAFAGQRILVTGAGGFIGSHLVERLVYEGARVRAFLHYNSRGDRGLLELLPSDVLEEVEVFWGDLRDAHRVQKGMTQIEGVFHLAALIGIPYSYHSPDAYVATNVGGTSNLLEASLTSSIEYIIHTSSSEVYGTAQRVPMNEQHPLEAQSPYAASKIGADQLAGSFHRSYGLPVATIRPFNAFGPRQSGRAVIPTIVGQALRGGDIHLGSLDTTRDFTYVADTVNAFVLMALNKHASVGEVINIGTGRGVTIGEAAATVLRMLDSNARVVPDPDRLRPERSEVLKLTCDSTKAKALIGWEAAYTFEQGLREVIYFMARQSIHAEGKAYAI